MIYMINRILPENIASCITEKTEEIRIKIKCPVVILDRDREIILPEIITKDAFRNFR